MPIFKITDLRTSELAQPPTLDSFLPCHQSGVTKQVSVLQIKQFLGDGTVRSLTAGQGLVSDPTPITTTGTISFSCPGLMSLFAGDQDPSGWLICNGRSLVVSQYQSLFNSIGYVYGGSGVNFNIPNLIGKSAFGPDQMESSLGPSGRVTVEGSNTLGATAGQISHVLSGTQTPLVSHTHSASSSFSVPTAPDRYGNNSSRYTGRPRKTFNTTSGGCSQTLSLDIQNSTVSASAPQTQAHPNLPPFCLLNWIIKT